MLRLQWIMLLNPQWCPFRLWMLFLVLTLVKMRMALWIDVGMATGLDQRRCKVHVFFDEMTDMVNVLQSALLCAGYNLKTRMGNFWGLMWSQSRRTIATMTSRRKNGFRKFSIHTYVKYQPSGKADANNNQDSGLPVIYNLDDPKILKFKLINWYTRKLILGGIWNSAAY